MTLKTDTYALCKHIVEDFPGWTFTSGGDFKNASLKHTDLIVSPGFTFTGGNVVACTVVQPTAIVTNKKVKKLGKQLIGYDRWLGIIDFVLDIEKYRRRGSIRYIFAHKADPWVPGFVLLEEAEPHLREILVDGIGIIERYFDLSSEENLLRNLPTGYHRDDNWGPGVFYENWDGISHCLVALVLGNFDFVERYASPDFKTMGPKREVELSKILAALPELKRKFAETGSVI